MANHQNEKGFTLLSSLLALSIIIITLPLLVSLINMMNSNDHYDALSVSRYFSYMHDEAIQAEDWSISEKKLNLKLANGENVVFTQKENLVVRQLNNGYEIYLRDVKNVRFEDVSYGVRIHITTQQGERYAKTITFY